MPLNRDLKKVLVIGSGPIIIGQAAEFDYSGTQAIEALKEEGLQVVLINSNPATIMTDKELADKVYLEPLTIDYVKKVIIQENPCAVLPTLGGQTGLNLALDLARSGFLDHHHVKLLGVNLQTIQEAEDRELFKQLCARLGEPTPKSLSCGTLDEAMGFKEEVGLPLIIRPAFTLGGSGGGIAKTEKDFKEIVESGLRQSPITQILLEQSIEGMKEIEYEIIRDHNDNAIVVCNMENFDPVGIHTGDSIVVAPSQTLNDHEYQMLRDVSIRLVRALKINGGCNVQLALDPKSQNYYVIEVNPRVSRSSALASKATGYPIAKVASKIAIGYNMDEIINPVTKKTYACFEPSLDYIVTKIPRWPFDKFTKAKRKLSSQMMATGEVMAIGRNFEESLLKAIRSLEIKVAHPIVETFQRMDTEELEKAILEKNDERLFILIEHLRRHDNTNRLHELTAIDHWFLSGLKRICDLEREIKTKDLSEELLLRAKKMGFCDQGIAFFQKKTTSEITKMRHQLHIHPSFKMVDTCAGEFESSTPYYYSTYEEYCELEPLDKKSVIVLGSGPIRIGQGVEFDYATVHAVWAIREMGYAPIVINNNPETVSTDFKTSDQLFFDPLHPEDVLEIIKKTNPYGVIVQFGGQTAINLTKSLQEVGVHILGTSANSIDLAEDRKKFESVLKELEIAQPLGTTVTHVSEAMTKAIELSYPLMLRPSYVIGGEAMEVVYDENELKSYFHRYPNQTILMDRYIIGLEVEVDAICDGKDILIPGIMEHIERAGVHSGDSYAVYPPQSLSQKIKEKLVSMTERIARRLEVKGLVNLQFVIKKDEIFVIEVNPRASRTVPFLSKITDIPMANIATKCVLGSTLTELGYTPGIQPEEKEVSVKAPVFSSSKLRDVDTALGPEMKSTGEAMGRDYDFQKALLKAFQASGVNLPTSGTILVTLADKHKEETIPLLKRFHSCGFTFRATTGTCKVLQGHDLPVREIAKIGESDFDLLDEIREGKVDMILNTITKGKNVKSDGFQMRRAAAETGIICLTSLDTANALCKAIEMNTMRVFSL